jgi:hypothetical protein
LNGVIEKLDIAINACAPELAVSADTGRANFQRWADVPTGAAVIVIIHHVSLAAIFSFAIAIREAFFAGLNDNNTIAAIPLAVFDTEFTHIIDFTVAIIIFTVTDFRSAGVYILIVVVAILARDHTVFIIIRTLWLFGIRRTRQLNYGFQILLDGIGINGSAKRHRPHVGTTVRLNLYIFTDMNHLFINGKENRITALRDIIKFEPAVIGGVDGGGPSGKGDFHTQNAAFFAIIDRSTDFSSGFGNLAESAENQRQN